MSTNISSNITRYAFLPVDLVVRATVQSFNGFCGVYAILANAMVLYLVNKLKKRRRRERAGLAFDRSHVTATFIQSLAVSDLLCGCFSVPIIIVVDFLDIMKTDLVCQVTRFVSIFFPVVTIDNLFIIGIERYLAVFHPFRVPSHRTVKYLVAGAWVLGAVLTIILSTTYLVLPVDIEPGIYTTICIYDKTVAVYRIIMFVFFAMVYVVPAIILSVTNTHILLYLRKRQVQQQCQSQSQQSSENRWRFKETIMFVTLIFTFVFPYFLYVTFTVINIILKPQMSFTAQYTVRRVMVSLAYSNAAISPTIMLFTLKSLALEHLPCLKRRRNAVLNDSSTSKDPNVVTTTF